MNNRQNGRRRGRGGQQARNGQPGNPHSNSRLDNRQRGNAAQLLEKYKTLARDAQMQGDRVNTEYYLQFADHYFRVLSENRSRFEEQRRPRDDFGQEYGTEDEGEQAPRAYGTRDFAEDGWDDGDEEGEARPQTQREPQPQREPQAQREPQVREQPQRESRDQREPREPREAREPREPRAFQPRGERRQAHAPRANGAAPASSGGNGAAPPEQVNEAPQATGGANGAPPAEQAAAEPTSRIEFDGLPPALTAAAEQAPQPAPEASEDGVAAPKRRRARKPKVATDQAVAEA